MSILKRFKVTTIDGMLIEIEEVKGARFYHVPTFYGMEEFELSFIPIVSKVYQGGNSYDDYSIDVKLISNGMVDEE